MTSPEDFEIEYIGSTSGSGFSNEVHNPVKRGRDGRIAESEEVEFVREGTAGLSLGSKGNLANSSKREMNTPTKRDGRPKVIDDISHKKQKREVPLPLGHIIDLHHRSVFRPPHNVLTADDRETTDLSNTEICPILDDFVIFHPPPIDNRDGLLCSLTVFDYDVGTDRNDGMIKNARDKIGDGVQAFGWIRGKTGAGVGVILPVIATYSVSVDDEHHCSIYLHTTSRTYKLGNPLGLYSDMFHSFWVIHQSIALVCRTGLDRPNESAKGFLASIQKTWDHKGSTVRGLSDEIDGNLIRPGAFVDQLGRIHNMFNAYAPSVIKPASANQRDETRTLLLKIKRSTLYVQLRDLARETPIERRRLLGIKDIVTVPIIAQLTDDVNRMQEKLLKNRQVKQEISVQILEVDDSDNEDSLGPSDGKVKWLSRGNLPKTDNERGQRGEKKWEGMRLNGEVYWLGDVVSVRVGSGEKDEALGLLRSLRQTTPPDGSRRKKAHVHWMRSLPIGEEGEMFLEDSSCDDIAIKHISRKVECQMLSSDERRGRQRFCRFVYHKDVRFRKMSHFVECDSCTSKIQATRQSSTSYRRNSLTTQSETYHLNEFVLVECGITGQAHHVGQIQELPKHQDTKVTLRMLRRYADLKDIDFADESRLYLTSECQEIPINMLRGKAIVVHKEGLTRYHGKGPVYYCPDRSSSTAKSARDLVFLQRPLRGCSNCVKVSMERQSNTERFDKLKKLPFADYYSGGGGGVLSATPYFDVQCAVEMNMTACTTLELNHPHTSVCCAPVDILHDRELRREKGEAVHDILDPRDALQPPSRQRRVPALPARGSVVGVMAGIPCQGHSRTNRFQDPNDPRNEELFKMMSEVQRLSPDYIVLENVAGFKDVRDDGTFAMTDQTSSWAHATMRLLLASDYQFTLGVLDSRAFGSPQNRLRLWIIAARRGVTLPKFPHPTHANPHPKKTIISIDGKEIHSFYADGDGFSTPGTGAHPAITVKDAISDLPSFEFKPPIGMNIPTNRIPSFSAARVSGDATRVGFVTPLPYRTKPSTSYQIQQRGSQILLKDHFTPSRSQAEVELVFAAFTDPSPPGNARRLDPDGGFHTQLTTSAPGGKTTAPIHYDQRRTRTIAEGKRAMGFPDSYILSGTAEEMDSQLGNAWVVPMGQAIVSAIRDVIRDEWVKAGCPDDLFGWWRGAHPVPPRKA